MGHTGRVAFAEERSFYFERSKSDWVISSIYSDRQPVCTASLTLKNGINVKFKTTKTGAELLIKNESWHFSKIADRSITLLVTAYNDTGSVSTRRELSSNISSSNELFVSFAANEISDLTPLSKTVDRLWLLPAENQAGFAISFKGAASNLLESFAACVVSSIFPKGIFASPDKVGGQPEVVKDESDRLSANKSPVWGQTFKAMVQKCWKKPKSNPGSRYEVSILLSLNADGSIGKQPKVMNASSDKSTEEYQNSAVLAVLACAPYKLPKEHYDEWRLFEAVFDSNIGSGP